MILMGGKGFDPTTITTANETDELCSTRVYLSTKNIISDPILMA